MNLIIPTYRPPSATSTLFIPRLLSCSWVQRWSIFLTILFLLIFHATVVSAANQPTIQGIRTISSADATRVVISLSAPIRYELIPEHSSKTSATPSRLHIRFSPAHIAPGIRTTATVDDGILKEVRTGLLADSIVRVSLVIDQLGTYRATTSRSPDQVVIQLRKQAENRTSTRSLPLPRPKISPVKTPLERDIALTPSDSISPPLTTQLRSPTPSLSATSQPKESVKPRVILPPPLPPSPPPSPVNQSDKTQQRDVEREEQQSLSEKEHTVLLKPVPNRAERTQSPPRSDTIFSSPEFSNKQERPAPPPVQPKEPIERQVALISPRPFPAPTPPDLQEQPFEPMTPEERYRIVIDPGHGGSDPGALGVGGIQEKNVVLAVSKRLAQKLRKRLGAEVILTRTTDVFIPLPERTARANAAKADLFVSIHANASPNGETQGIETYYLNNTNDRATIRLAKLENGIRAKQQLPHREASLSYILSDLIQTSKEEESIALAEAVQIALVDRARKQVPFARDLGVKQGPFYVLVGAHMPCILVELAFLTHPDEGRRLGSAPYQEILAEGLFLGIADFLRTGPSAKNL